MTKSEALTILRTCGKLVRPISWKGRDVALYYWESEIVRVFGKSLHTAKDDPMFCRLYSIQRTWEVVMDDEEWEETSFEQIDAEARENDRVAAEKETRGGKS